MRYKKTSTTYRNYLMTHVDNESGEILGESGGDNVKTTIIETRPLTQEELLYQPWPLQFDVDFLRMFRGQGELMKKKLTNTEIATLVYLTDFICYDDCVLRENGNKLGHAMTIKELAERIGLLPDSFRKTMDSLSEKGIVGYHKTGTVKNGSRWITVNPYVFCRGKAVDGWVQDFYKSTIWNDIPNLHEEKRASDTSKNEEIVSDNNEN